MKENINQVSAMKLSPYFRVFEEEANTWEDKLNRILTIFDVWIDVQRRWVYLEGIFTGISINPKGGGGVHNDPLVGRIS